MSKILIADDDRIIRTSLSMLLRHAGYETLMAANQQEALSILRAEDVTLVIMDMNFSGSTDGSDGIELLRKSKVLRPEVPVILITAWGSIPLAVAGMKYGAFDFITKPWDSRLLLQRVATAIEISHPELQENSQSFTRDMIIGESPALLDVLRVVERVAPTDASVLITGENGTGKELIAQTLHANSFRRNAPFVMVNLGGMPSSLFESEMFGHAKGAFTGAVSNRKGRFECADKGTIFLDEIGELDINCQVKLLRVLQQHAFEPLGESRPVKIDFRTVCATNANLGNMMREKTFREDLYYRINTISVHLPPLRERRDDIPLLVRYFAALHPSKPVFSSDAVALLCRLPYPGNVRQLKNIVDRAVLVSGKSVITDVDIDATGLDNEQEQAANPNTPTTLEELERNAILQALDKHAGNMKAAALELGITRQSLYRRLEKFGIKL